MPDDRHPAAGRGRRRRLAECVLLAAAAAVIAGCGSGFDAQTVQTYNPVVGVDVRGGGVDVLNALVVDNGDGTGTLSAALLNDTGTPDKVTSVQVTTTTGAPVDTATNVDPLRLCPQVLLNIGPSGAVTVEGNNVQAGRMVDLSIRFRNAAPVDVAIPVVERSETYNSVAAKPSKSATLPPCPSSALPTGTP